MAAAQVSGPLGHRGKGQLGASHFSSGSRNLSKAKSGEVTSGTGDERLDEEGFLVPQCKHYIPQIFSNIVFVYWDERSHF